MYTPASDATNMPAVGQLKSIAGLTAPESVFGMIWRACSDFTSA